MCALIQVGSKCLGSDTDCIGVETRCSSHSEEQNIEVLLVHCLMILGDDSCQNKRMTSLFGIFNVEGMVSPRKANTLEPYLVMISYNQRGKCFLWMSLFFVCHVYNNLFDHSLSLHSGDC